MLDQGSESCLALLERFGGLGALSQIGDFALGEGNPNLQPVEFERLREVVVRTSGNHQLDIIEFAATGEDQDHTGRTARTRAESSAQVDTVETREIPIEDSQVEDGLVNRIPGRFGIAKGGDIMTAPSQEIDNHLTDLRVVFDDKCAHTTPEWTMSDSDSLGYK
jgi:hypothetical protein